MFCTRCGAEIHEEAVICINCGCPVAKNTATNLPTETDNVLEIIIKVFLVLGCLSLGWLLIPLIWCIPLTVIVFNRLGKKKKIGVGIKICVLLFVNLVAGICLLCMETNDC